jgi:hypothetical protein
MRAPPRLDYNLYGDWFVLPEEARCYVGFHRSGRQTQEEHLRRGLSCWRRGRGDTTP